MNERQRPFVAYLTKVAAGGLKPNEWDHIAGSPRGEELGYREWVACVVTPLLPDDPKPGETWEWCGRRVEICGAPFRDDDHGCWRVSAVDHEVSESFVFAPDIADLRRPPVLKTFRLRGVCLGPKEIVAESKEAALAKLAESLEEVG